MSAIQRTRVIASGLFLALLLSTMITLHRVNELRTGSSLEEVLYIPSPATIKRLSLGYDGLMADIYWTRAVQYFGGRHSSGMEQFRLLAPLLEITTYLDPHLIVAYEFGAQFLAPAPPNGAGEPDRAIALVENGIRHNPDTWRLYYNLGFIYYFEKRDYAQAAEAFERGSRVPGAHPFLKIMAASMAQHAGEITMARMLWYTIYDSTTDKQIKGNAAGHIRALKVDEDVTVLESIVNQYREQTGQWPTKFAQLIGAGMIKSVPLDPTGQPYQIMPGGRVEVRNPDDLPFITKGTPPGYRAPKKVDPKKLPTRLAG